MGGLWEDFPRELDFAIGTDLNFGDVRSVIGGRAIPKGGFANGFAAFGVGKGRSVSDRRPSVCCKMESGPDGII